MRLAIAPRAVHTVVVERGERAEPDKRSDVSEPRPPLYRVIMQREEARPLADVSQTPMRLFNAEGRVVPHIVPAIAPIVPSRFREQPRVLPLIRRVGVEELRLHSVDRIVRERRRVEELPRLARDAAAATGADSPLARPSFMVTRAPVERVATEPTPPLTVSPERGQRAAPKPALAPPLDLDRLTEQVVRQIDSRIVALRERLGRPF